MDTGTPFCPDHRDLRIPPFKTECPVCNRTLLLWKDAYVKDPAQIKKDFDLLKEPKEPEVQASGADVWAKPEPKPLKASPPFAELRAKIEAKTEEVKEEEVVVKPAPGPDPKEKEIVLERLAAMDEPILVADNPPDFEGAGPSPKADPTKIKELKTVIRAKIAEKKAKKAPEPTKPHHKEKK